MWLLFLLNELPQHTVAYNNHFFMLMDSVGPDRQDSLTAPQCLGSQLRRFQGNLMAGAEIIWKPLHWFLEPFGKTWRVELPSSLSVASPCVCSKWLGLEPSMAALGQLDFLHGSTRLQAWLFSKPSDGCIIFCDLALEATQLTFAVFYWPKQS